ncbi:preprotein translocase subunit SecY [Planctomycetaceae bacterium SCGC AG-212-F19]|nr:preprotein translocase subunit SecY [Planctomycetaceae bacterium SCGC AG-212-F19]
MHKLLTIFKIPELTRKILITALFLVVYRVGFYIPLPIIDQERMVNFMRGASQGALGQIFSFVSLFSGGTLSQSCIFGLGVMPYISASIIFQLLANIYPPLEKLQKEGESGRKKINEYTRYATVFICMLQAFFWVNYITRPESSGGAGLAAPGYDSMFFSFTAVMTMTAGTIFLMWLGEQIDEYGIGNGISLIIMAGIVCRIPDATRNLLFDTTTGKLKDSIFTLGGSTGHDVSFEKLVVLLALFVGVVVAVIAITKGQRRIPTQSAKHVRGRRVYGGTRQYLPLRVNQAGVMPVIFASSLLMLPYFGFNVLYRSTGANFFGFLQDAFQRQGYVYNVFYIALIYFFCYFWTSIVFNPKDMANNLKDYGSFIPGYRPGKRTADYLERVMIRITYVGAAFLAVVAVVPSVIQYGMDVDYRVASFYGGTGLLIVISVALDLVQKINSHLVMRNYPGLTED